MPGQCHAGGSTRILHPSQCRGARRDMSALLARHAHPVSSHAGAATQMHVLPELRREHAHPAPEPVPRRARRDMSALLVRHAHPRMQPRRAQPVQAHVLQNLGWDDAYSALRGGAEARV